MAFEPLTATLNLADSALGLGKAIVERLNLKDKQKYVDRVREVKLAYQEENDKPDGTRSDARLEDLERELLVEVEAMNNAIQAGITAVK